MSTPMRRASAALTSWGREAGRYCDSTSTTAAVKALLLSSSRWPTMGGIAERGALAPLLVLITARPEFRPSWGTRSHHAAISLVPLDRQQVRQMVGELDQKCCRSTRFLEPSTLSSISNRCGHRGRRGGSRHEG